MNSKHETLLDVLNKERSITSLRHGDRVFVFREPIICGLYLFGDLEKPKWTIWMPLETWSEMTGDGASLDDARESLATLFATYWDDHVLCSKDDLGEYMRSVRYYLQSIVSEVQSLKEATDATT